MPARRIPNPFASTYQPASDIGRAMQGVASALFSGTTPYQDEEREALAAVRGAQARHYNAEADKTAEEVAALRFAGGLRQEPRVAETVALQTGYTLPEVTGTLRTMREGYDVGPQQPMIPDVARELALVNNGMRFGGKVDELSKARHTDQTAGFERGVVMGAVNPTRFAQSQGKPVMKSEDGVFFNAFDTGGLPQVTPVGEARIYKDTNQGDAYIAQGENHLAGAREHEAGAGLKGAQRRKVDQEIGTEAPITVTTPQGNVQVPQSVVGKLFLEGEKQKGIDAVKPQKPGAERAPIDISSKEGDAGVTQVLRLLGATDKDGNALADVTVPDETRHWILRRYSEEYQRTRNGPAAASTVADELRAGMERNIGTPWHGIGTKVTKNYPAPKGIAVDPNNSNKPAPNNPARGAGGQGQQPPVVVKTPEEARRLPPGTVFIDPNGVRRVVPGGA